MKTTGHVRASSGIFHHPVDLKTSSIASRATNRQQFGIKSIADIQNLKVGQFVAQSPPLVCRLAYGVTKVASDSQMGKLPNFQVIEIGKLLITEVEGHRDHGAHATRQFSAMQFKRRQDFSCLCSPYTHGEFARAVTTRQYEKRMCQLHTIEPLQPS